MDNFIKVTNESAADSFVTISMTEFTYLTRVDALVDVIIQDDSGYTISPAARAAIKAIKIMRGTNDEAVGAE